MNTTLLFLFALIILYGLPVAIMERLFKERKKRLFPFNDKLSRPPGYSTGKKRDEIRLELALKLLFCFGLAFLAAVCIFLVENQWFKGLGFILVLGEIYFLKKARDLLRDLNNWSLGFAGELVVGQSLNQLMLKGYHVFHDLEFEGKFNIDHVLVGKNGVFAIETKAKTKIKAHDNSRLFKVEYDGKALYFEDNPEIPHTRFLKQANKQASSLKNELTSSTGDKVSVVPVLVLPGWMFILKVDQNNAKVKLLNHNKLDALTNLKTGIELSDSEISRIIHQLKQICEDVDMNKGKWGE